MKNLKFYTMVCLMVISLGSQTPFIVSSAPNLTNPHKILDIESFDRTFTGVSGEEQLLTKFPQLTSDSSFSKIDKIGPILNNWIKEGELKTPISMINNKKSIMLLTTSDDPSLGGKIDPVGHFKLGNSGIKWVHTYISDINDLNNLIAENSVIKIQADRDNLGLSSSKGYFDKTNREKVSPSGLNLDQITNPDDAREIIGINQVEQQFGYTGKDVVINVLDDGIDFGHSALYGTLALDKNNESASFDGLGYSLAVSSLYSQNYYNNLIETPNPTEAAKFGPLYKDASGYIDTSNLDNLIIWDVFFGLEPASNYSLPWLESIPVPDQIYVGNLPGNNTGYAFGIAAVLQSYFGIFEMILSPFVVSDSDNNGDYDSLHIDYQTTDLYTRMWLNNISRSRAISNSNFNFTAFSPHQNHNNQYLAADIFTGDEKSGSDGFNDVSLGALGSTYDVQNVTGRIGNQSPMIDGIDSSGEVFAYFTNMWGDHGTAVTGEIVARPIAFPLDTGESINVTGIAPDADIIGSYFVTDSSKIYSYLWSTGYEPDSTLEWNFINDHVANISSNSWGYPIFERDNFAYQFDFMSLFMDLLSHPGYLSPSHPGILFVISAGNSGSGYGTSNSPLPGTGLMVGASTNFKFMEYEALGLFGIENSVSGQGFDEITTFSTAGPATTNYPIVDVVNIGLLDFTVAPVVFAGRNNQTWTSFSGTSEAAPLTAGSLAVIYEAYKDTNNMILTPDQAKVLVKSTAKDLGLDSYRQGNGRVDVARAVNQIVSGSISSKELFLIETIDSYNNLGSRLETAFSNWFVGGEELNVSGYSGLNHPSTTLNYLDNNIYAGQIVAGSSKMVNIDITGTANSVNAYEYSTSFSNVNPTTFDQTKNVTFYSLDSLFGKSNYQNAEFVQLSVAIKNGFQQRNSLGILPFLWIGTHSDINSDNQVQYNEFQFYDLNFNSHNVYSAFLSQNITQKDAYIGIHDFFFDSPLKNEDLSYQFSIRAFDRISASDVSVSNLGGGSYEITFSPSSAASPGFYEGFIEVKGSNGGYGLAPFSYSVLFEVEDYDVAGEWNEISGIVNRPYENAVFGAGDFLWRFPTGDWRFYDLKLSGSLTNTNTLGMEIEWTYPNTVLDVYVFDAAGEVITTSDVDYIGAGRFNSRANSPPQIQRLLVNLTDYRIGNTIDGGDFSSGYDVLSIALHTVRIDTDALPYDPITVRAAWVTETISEFNHPIPQLVTTGSDVYKNSPVTTDVIGVEWSEVTSNPIPTFVTSGQETKIEVLDFLEFNRQGTIPSNELVSYPENNRIEAERIWELTLAEGMTVSAELSWEIEGSDFDFLLIPKGENIAFENDVFRAQLATLNNPERGQTTIPETGIYQLVVEWYDGNAGQDQPFELEFFATKNIFSTVSTSTLNLNTSLESTSLQNNQYFLKSSLTGWNFPNEINSTFIYDSVGPQPQFDNFIPESKTTGNVNIGTIHDAVEYSYTISKDGTTITSANNINGTNEVFIDASKVTGVAIENTFRLTGDDALGKSTDITFKISRSDDTDPSIVSNPNAEVSAEQGKDFTVTYVIEDSTDGTYMVAANGINIQDGTWQPNTDIDITLNFDEITTYFVLVTFEDDFGNIEDHSFKVIVGEASPEPTTSTTTTGKTRGGFLPIFPISITFLVLFVLIFRRRIHLKITNL